MHFYCYVYVFLFYVYVWLPWLRFFRAFSSAVRKMSGYNPQRRGTARNLPNFCVFLCIFVLFYVFLCCSMYSLCCSMYCLFCVVLCIVCVYLCTVLLPLGGYPIAVNRYIVSYVQVTFSICGKWALLPQHGASSLCGYRKSLQM